MKKIKVRVTKSSSSDYWYAAHIGEVFEVENASRDEWRFYDEGGFGYTIGKEDSEIVED